MDPFRQGGPVRAAATWLHHVKVNHDLESAWPLTHRDYREFLVDTWLSRFGDGEALAGGERTAIREALLDDTQPATTLPAAVVWDRLCVTTLAALDALWETIVWEHSGWGSEERIVAPGHEVAVIFDKATDEPVTLNVPTQLRGISFELKGSDGSWLLSNVVANESDDPDRTWRPGDPAWRPMKAD
ncbi:MAG: hypothetical protein WD181_02475 [Solirubrobacterales bacterium]